MAKKILVNDALEHIRKINMVTENNIINDAKRLYDIASGNKVGNKIMASVPLYLIYIDDTYQRTETFSKAKASEIAANFIEAAYDPIKLNYRNGRFFCPAGQHRIYAHILMGKTSIEAELFSVTYNEEIDVFLTQDDNRSKLTPYDRFKAGLAFGKWEDVTLKELCDKYNVEIGTKSVREKGNIGSITTAKGILTTFGAEGLEWILSVIQESGWTTEKRGYDSRTFRALKNVYSRTEQGKGKNKLVAYLKKTTPVLLYANSVAKYPTKDPESAMTFELMSVIQEKNKTRILKAN